MSKACISADGATARAAAKATVARYGALPFYNQLFRNSGFVQEAEALRRGNPQAVSDRMAEELVLIGPPARCRARVEACRAAGIQLPIIRPVPVGDQTYEQALRVAIETFA